MLLIATIAAAVFGIVPLVAARASAELGGYDTTDLFIFRLAAAATLGYAAAGILQWRASSASAIRVQVVAAAVFNGLSAAAAALYLATGGRSPVALVILVAAAAFAVAFIWWLAATRGRREVA